MLFVCIGRSSDISFRVRPLPLPATKKKLKTSSGHGGLELQRDSIGGRGKLAHARTAVYEALPPAYTERNGIRRAHHAEGAAVHRIHQKVKMKLNATPFVGRRNAYGFKETSKQLDRTKVYGITWTYSTNITILPRSWSAMPWSGLMHFYLWI